MNKVKSQRVHKIIVTIDTYSKGSTEPGNRTESVRGGGFRISSGGRRGEERAAEESYYKL